MTSNEIPPCARATGAHRGDHEVGAHAGGDEGLGAVDDEVVAVAHGARGRIPATSRAAAGLGDGERADQLPGQRRRHPRSICRFPGFSRSRRSGAACDMPQVNKAANSPPEPAGVVHLLVDRDGVDQRPRRHRRPRPGCATPSRPSAPAFFEQLARQLAGALPRVQVRQHLLLGEPADGVPSVLCVPRSTRPDRTGGSLLASFQQGGGKLDGARPQPFAQALGLRVEAGLGGDTGAEHALDDEVHGAQVREQRDA